MEAQAVTKRSLLMQLIALFLFLIICGFFSMLTLLTIGGEYSSNCKMALVVLVFCRLAWQIYKHTFRFRDYFIYFAIVIVFCFLADYAVTR
jgi:hypothetical protein